MRQHDIADDSPRFAFYPCSGGRSREPGEPKAASAHTRLTQLTRIGGGAGVKRVKLIFSCVSGSKKAGFPGDDVCCCLPIVLFGGVDRLRYKPVPIRSEHA